MSGTKCPVSGTNQLVPDKMSGTLGYLFSGLHGAWEEQAPVFK